METQDLAAMLEARFDKLEVKLDKLQDHAASADVTLAQQAKDISHHIHRTDLLEERVEQVATMIEPIKDHVARVRSIGWFIGGLLGLVTTIMGIMATLTEMIGGN
jgi:uncharacterized coiled-coil protein SlyX